MVLTLLACTSVTVLSDPAGGSSATVAHDSDDVEEVGGQPDSNDTGPGNTDGACQPGGGPVYVTEGEEAVLTLHCRAAGDATDWAVLNLPDGASFDAKAKTVRWTPALDQAGRWDLAVQATTTEVEDGSATIWVADAWDDRQNTPIDPIAYEEEFGLPVLHIDKPKNMDDWNSVATQAVYRGHTYDIELQYRGAASRYYPKNSYKLAFAAGDEFEDKAESFDNRRNIVITSTFDDNAYFRQKLCFDIWNALRPDRPQQMQSMFVVVYLSDEYEGLYLLTDHVDREYWKDQGFTEAINMYKSVDHSANFYDTYGGAKSSWHSGYEQKEAVDTTWADIDALVEFVSEASTAEFEAGIADRIDIGDVYDWWTLVVFTEADDSAGKNAYLVNDPTAPIFRQVPWDFNHSLGQTWQTEREGATYAEDFTGANNLFRRLLDSPTYGDPMRQEMLDALDGALSIDELNGVIDEYMTKIGPSAARDWDKWRSQYRGYNGWNWRDDFTEEDEEIAYVRDWISARNAYVRNWIGN